MLYPKKNLLPPFTDIRWRLHPSAAKLISDYEIEYNQTSSYQTTAIDLDLKPGVKYTLSIPSDANGPDKSPLNGAAMYISFTKNGSTTYPSFPAGKTSFTVTGDPEAKVLLGIHDNTRQGVASRIKNLMLVEGDLGEDFEPYELGMKQAKEVSENLVKPFGHPDYYFPPVSEGKFTIISPIRIELNATSFHNYLRYPIEVEPYTTYSVRIKHNGIVGVYGDDGSTALQAYTNAQTFTFNSGSWTTVRLYMTNLDLGSKNYFFEEPQVNKGSLKDFSTYSLGLKKSKGVSSVNLVNPDVSKWKQGSLDSAGNLTGGSTRLVFLERIKMSPNTKYTVKVNNGYRVFMRNFSDASVEISNSGWVTDGYVFTTPSNIKSTMVLISRGDDGGLNVDEVANALPMLAQGEWDRNLPYEEVMRPYIGLPEKNLIPDFNDSRWFDDVTVAIPTVTVYSDNPYGMRMVITGGAQGRLIWIPVEVGKTYTFSFGKITGLYRMYKRKVNNHDTNMVLVQDGSVGKPDTFSFTVDDTYGGYVTLRLTHGSAATLYYENLQLEEGTQTQFEKMSLTKLKPAILYPKKNLYDYVSNAFELGSISSTTGLDGSILAYTMRTKGFIAVEPNTTYVYQKPLAYTQVSPYPFDSSKTYLGSGSRPTITVVSDTERKFTTPAGCFFIRLQFNHPDSSYVFSQDEIDNNSRILQIEEGSNSTKYEPYELGMKAN
jgi:hypothetical protein